MIYLNPKDRLKKEKEVISEAQSASEMYTVKELKAMCKEKGITGYSKMKEAELIKVLGL